MVPAVLHIGRTRSMKCVSTHWVRNEWSRFIEWSGTWVASYWYYFGDVVIVYINGNKWVHVEEQTTTAEVHAERTLLLEMNSFSILCSRLRRAHNWQAKGMHFQAITSERQQYQQIIGKTYFLASFYLDADTRKGWNGNKMFCFLHFSGNNFQFCIEWMNDEMTKITFDDVYTTRWCDLVRCTPAQDTCRSLFMRVQSK